MNDSFLSVVDHREKPGSVLVRSRIEGDIERAIAGAAVYQIEDADYRYRADVDRELLKLALANAVDRIDYGNFKNSVSDGARHAAYMKVWEVLANAFGAFGKRTGAG